MTNQQLATNVRIGLAEDPFINNLSRIDVHIEDEGVVILDGIVDTYNEKERAGEVTQGIEGVAEVVNNLEVHAAEIEQL